MSIFQSRRMFGVWRAGSIAGLALAGTTGSAQTYWTGTGSGQWVDSSSWSTGALPGLSDDVYVGYNYGSVVIPNPGALTLSVSALAYANNLYSKSMIDIMSGTALTLNGNLTTTALLTIEDNASLGFNNLATISGEVVFGSSGFSALYGSTTGTLTIASGSLVHGGYYGAIYGYSLVNQGTISSDAGGMLDIESAAFDNSAGVLSALNSSELDIDTNVTTAQLGTLRTYDNSRIVLDGLVDNTGATLDVSGDGATGSIELQGTLLNGKVKGDLGKWYGNVQDVEFLNAQTFTSGFGLNVTNSVKFDSGLAIGVNSLLEFDDTAVLTGDVSFTNGLSTYGQMVVDNGTLTLSSGSIVHGSNGIIFGTDLDNQGTISSDGGWNLRIQTTTFENEGETSAKNGSTMYVGANLENSGTLLVDSTSVIEFGGQVVENSGSVLSFAASSNSKFGTMNFDSTAILQGSLDFSLVGGYAPAAGTIWDIMNFADGYSGTLTGPIGYSILYGSNSISLERSLATPEPAPILVLAPCVVGLMARRRWRSRVRSTV